MQRQETARLFEVWWEKHQDQSVKAEDLDWEVRSVLNPNDKPRQWVTVKLQGLTGTRLAGFVLTREAAIGKWGTATYSLKRTDDPKTKPAWRGPHGGHRGRPNPEAPMGPMANDHPAIHFAPTRTCAHCRKPFGLGEKPVPVKDSNGVRVVVHSGDCERAITKGEAA